jgi:Transposase
MRSRPKPDGEHSVAYGPLVVLKVDVERHGFRSSSRQPMRIERPSPCLPRSRRQWCGSCRGADPHRRRGRRPRHTARSDHCRHHQHRSSWSTAVGCPVRRGAPCRHLSRRLQRDLLAAGERVVRVPPKLMAHVRDSARSYGKSDPIDALAVARAAQREPDLPVARLDGPDRKLRLLVDHRESLVAERTRLICRLRWHLYELDPARGSRRRAVWMPNSPSMRFRPG